MVAVARDTAAYLVPVDRGRHHARSLRHRVAWTCRWCRETDRTTTRADCRVLQMTIWPSQSGGAISGFTPNSLATARNTYTIFGRGTSLKQRDWS